MGKVTSKVFNLNGNAVGKVKIPSVFSTPMRPDVVKRAVVALQSHRFQPLGRDPMAGRPQAYVFQIFLGQVLMAAYVEGIESQIVGVGQLACVLILEVRVGGLLSGDAAEKRPRFHTIGFQCLAEFFSGDQIGPLDHDGIGEVGHII